MTVIGFRIIIALLGSLIAAAFVGCGGVLIQRRVGQRRKPLVNFLLGLVVVLTIAISSWCDGLDFGSLGFHLTAAGLGALAGTLALRNRWATAMAAGVLTGLLATFVMLFAVTDAVAAVDETFQPLSSPRQGLRQLVRELPESPMEKWELELAPEEVNAVISSALAARKRHPAVRVDIQDEQAIVAASIPVGTSIGVERFANFRAGLYVDRVDDRVRLRLEWLGTGRIEWPRFVVQRIGRLATEFLKQDLRLREIEGLVSDAGVRNGQFWLSGTNAPQLRRLVLQGMHGDDSISVSRDLVQEYVAVLAEKGATLGPGDPRFCGLVSIAFEHAQLRSAAGDPIAENRTAIIALALVIGNNHVDTVAGVESVALPSVFSYRFRRDMTLRGREDLALHFLISAALTALSSSATADSAGFVKEYLDAQAGGSGFSFADLAADRAGVQFASRAIRSRETAKQLQSRVAKGIQTDDLMPQLEGLIEGIRAQELFLDFGSYADKRFQSVVDEIDRKIARCPAYQ